jgi:hypothetical protein
MDLIDQIISESEKKQAHIRFIKTENGKIIIDVYPERKELRIGRVEPESYDNMKDLANILAHGYPLYHSIQTSLEHIEWKINIDQLFGWGVPFRQVHICAMSFIDDWNKLTENLFRNRIKSYMIETGMEIEVNNIEEYGYMIDALCNCMYKSKNDSGPTYKLLQF